MKNIRKLLLSLGLLLLSGNVAAIMIGGTVGNETTKMDLSMEEISSLLRNYRAETKQESKYLKKANKKSKKVNKLVRKMAGMDAAKARKKAGKLLKKQQQLASILSAMNLDLTAYVAAVANGGIIDGQTQPVYDDDTGAVYDNDTGGVKSVPEPSMIALLGIGLAGFGVARRFKQRT